MVHLKLVELIDSKFNPEINFFGFKNFLNNHNLSSLTAQSVFKNEEKLLVSYYCFDIPNELREKFSLGKKISPADLVDSSIYKIFSKELFYEMDKIYSHNFENYTDFKEKSKIISEIFEKYEDNLGNVKNERILEGGKITRIDSELNSLPFYSLFYKYYIKNQVRFLFSDFKINYFPDIREMVFTFKDEFNGKSFNYKEFNDFIFRKYGFFKVK